MNWLDELEKKLAGTVSGLAKSVASAPRQKSLIEVCKEVQEEIRGKILAQERGIRSFPYTRIDVRVFAKDGEQKAAYDAVLNGVDPFAGRIRGMLEEEGCRLREIAIDVSFAVDAEQTLPYVVKCSRPTRGTMKRAKHRLAAKLVVVRGESEVPELLIRADRVNIGRLREVESTTGTVLRINDLPFRESETTVAREHAFLKWDSAAGRFLLFDSISGSRGTRLFRSGESIQVPRGGSKGTALEDGDEIHLGTARVRFEMVEED